LNAIFLLTLVIILILNLIFIAWAVMDIMQRRNVKYLPKAGWIAVMAFILFGSVIYLLAGRGEDNRAA